MVNWGFCILVSHWLIFFFFSCFSYIQSSKANVWKYIIPAIIGVVALLVIIGVVIYCRHYKHNRTGQYVLEMLRLRPRHAPVPNAEWIYGETWNVSWFMLWIQLWTKRLHLLPFLNDKTLWSANEIPIVTGTDTLDWRHHLELHYWHPAQVGTFHSRTDASLK